MHQKHELTQGSIIETHLSDNNTDRNEDDSEMFEDMPAYAGQQLLDDHRAHNATFTLALGSAHNLVQSSIGDVIDSTSTLIEEHVSLYKAQVHAKLTELGI